MEFCAIDWLPTPEVIMTRSKAAAAADVLLSHDPDMRQYRCNANWQPGMAAAWRHDGGGSYYYVLQQGDAMAIKVAALRLSMAPDALARFQKNPDPALPPVAVRVLTEPEFTYQELSFLAWTVAGSPWKGLHFRVDGKTCEEMGKPLLELVCLGARAFYTYAQAYHELTIDPTALKAMFALTPLDEKLAKTIAKDANLISARKDLETIGYPLA